MGVAGYIVVGPVCRPVCSESLDGLGYATGTSDSFGVAVFIGVRPGGCRLRWGWLGSLGCSLVVIGFVRGRWVHFVGVVCFVRLNWVHWCAPWVWLGSFSVSGFLGVRPGILRDRSG